MEYETKKKNKTVYTSQRKTSTDIFYYEYYHEENGWWIIREHYNVNNPFPDRSEIYIPDEIIDNITILNTKEKLS